MATMYYDNDCDIKLLEGKVIGIIGYGSQGHAHAQNLRDSGCQVIVGLPETSKTRAKAEEDGFKVATAEEVARQADIIVMLVPDQLQNAVYNQEIVKGLSAGKTLMFAHGFFGEGRLDNSGPAAANALGIGQGQFPGVAGGILVYGHDGRRPLVLGV